MRFNTEVLESMGYDVRIDGPWVEVVPMNGQQLHVDGICDQMYEAGLPEGIVLSLANDIENMVIAQITMKAMTDSCRAAPPRHGKKPNKPRPA